MRLPDRTRRRLLQGAAAVPAAALGGCIATPYGPYYRPSSTHPQATLKGAWCGGVAGPKSVIELPLAPDVTLTARAERDYPERDRTELPLRVTLTLPASQPARFGSARLEVVELGSGKSVANEPEVRAFRYAALPADAWIDPTRVRPSGAAGTPLSEERYGSASVRVSMEPGFMPARLQVDGLSLALDGGSIKMPAIVMSRPASQSSVRDYRSAALHANLVERASACRRDTPKLACDNIVEHSAFSFIEDAPDARWAGRWYVFGDGPRARLEGEVTFAPRRAGRWRVESNAVTVRDAAGDERRTARFARINLALNDRIALDTPLFAGPVDGTGNARVSIEVLLPAAPPDFTVVLPELHLGAGRIEIPPLRFDRRTFDGGFEPFNC